MPARKKDSELKLEVKVGGEVGWKPAVPQMEMGGWEGRARVRGEREKKRGRRVVRCMVGGGVGSFMMMV